MRSSIRFGFGIAALFAAAVFALYFFGGGEEDWMLRAAGGEASHCVIEGNCAEIDAHGFVIRKAPAPLPKASLCAERKNWQAVKRSTLDRASLLFTCKDGRAYLVHIGTYRDGGPLQWMRCVEDDCKEEAALFVK